MKNQQQPEPRPADVDRAFDARFDREVEHRVENHEDAQRLAQEGVRSVTDGQPRYVDEPEQQEETAGPSQIVPAREVLNGYGPAPWTYTGARDLHHTTCRLRRSPCE